MATKYSSLSSICCKCNKNVSGSEAIAVLNKVWHRKCFQCANCDKSLNLFNMCSFDGKPYCEYCYNRWAVQQASQINKQDTQSNGDSFSEDDLDNDSDDQRLLSLSINDNSLSSTGERNINILVFGESGAGKSSLINMLFDEVICETSENAIGCTSESKTNEKILNDYGGVRLRIYDTAGLGESDHGTISNKNAFLKLVQTLYRTKKDGGIHLLICCHRSGSKISTETFKQNYHSFIEIICEDHVPSILCITHCDQDKTLDTWLENNQTYVQQYFQHFQAILTVAANKQAKHLDINEYHLSRKKTIEAILKYSLDKSWKMTSIRKNILVIFKQFCNTIQRRISFLKAYSLNEDFVRAFCALGFEKQQAVVEANMLFNLLQNSTKIK